MDWLQRYRDSVRGRAWKTVRAAGLSVALCVPAVLGGASAAHAASVSSKPVAQKDPVAFTVEHLPRSTETSVTAMAARAVIRAFLQDHPDYVINPFVMPAIQGAALDTAPLMGIASGRPPHAIYVNFRQSSSYINHGFLEPLEGILARVLSDNPRVREADAANQWLADPTPQEVDAAREQIRSRVVERVWPVVYRKADVQKKGIPEGEHVWAMPTRVLVRTLLYRKDVFQEAGLDPEQPPRDWDELMAYSRKISAVPSRYGLAFGGGPSISWGAYSFMVSNGVRYMDQDEEGRWRAAFATPEAAESIYYILRMARESYDTGDKTRHGVAYAPSSGADMYVRWARGEIGMRFAYLSQEMLANINPELIGLAPIPLSPLGTRSGEINSEMLGVFADATPAQKIAVMRYIWFITSDQAKRIRVRVMVENGFGKFVNPDLLEKFGYDDILRTVPPGWREMFATAAAAGVPEPYGRNTQFIYTKVSEPINWALQEDGLLDLPRAEALRRIEEKLQDTAERVDLYMLGKLSPQEWTRRRVVGGVGLGLVLLVFSLSLGLVWRSFSRADAAMGDRPPLRRFTVAYLLMLPALLIVVLWQYGPVIMGLPLAMFDYELVIESQFVGLDNLATVLYDARFWSSLVRTFYYVLLVVGLGFWPPILLAILLDEVPTTWAKYLFRTIFYLPSIVSGIIMVFLWRQFYDPSEKGFLNQVLLLVNHLGPVGGTVLKWVLLGVWLLLIGFLVSVVFHLKELSLSVRAVVMAFALSLLGATLWPLIQAYQGPSEIQAAVMTQSGIDPASRMGVSGVVHTLGHLVGQWDLQPLGWIDDPGLAMICCVIPSIWATAGIGCIIYLAALKTVPEELVEAASIDGAGILQKITYITLPRIKFLILINLVGAIVAAFKGGTNFILAMTGGGPNGATRVLGMDIFERSFMELKYGIGASMGWFLGGLVIMLTAWQIHRMSRAEFKSAATTEDPKA